MTTSKDTACHALELSQQDMASHGTSTADVLPNFLWVAGYTVAFLILGVLAFGRKTSGR